MNIPSPRELRFDMKQIALLLTTILFTATTYSATEKATFAGGCFWCMEPPFDAIDGVISTTSGYTGGHQLNPNYQDVSSGRSGHVEVVEVVFDPAKTSYEQLLRIFWVNIDPVNNKGQFCDNGSQYLSAIFYHNEAQQKAAKKSLNALQTSTLFNLPIATTLHPATTFYPAEEYHQNYYQKNPVRYKYYRYGCRRDMRLKQLWKGVNLPF